jgi:hypothetical protein
MSSKSNQGGYSLVARAWWLELVSFQAHDGSNTNNKTLHLLHQFYMFMEVMSLNMMMMIINDVDDTMMMMKARRREKKPPANWAKLHSESIF